MRLKMAHGVPDAFRVLGRVTVSWVSLVRSVSRDAISCPGIRRVSGADGAVRDARAVLRRWRAPQMPAASRDAQKLSWDGVTPGRYPPSWDARGVRDAKNHLETPVPVP